ncbi:MAG: MOSC domain-containing protein, partial [Acidimicrobiia bacterium]
GTTQTMSYYDAGRRVEVDRLEITPSGIEAALPGGERVLDIHHLDHPGKAYDDDDLVCIGFSAHYDAMRTEFGEHMVDGVAGENILIDVPSEVWLDDLAERLAIENQDTGELAILEMVGIATPCVEFSRFCARRQHEKVPTRTLGEILRFLGKGRRGFLLVLEEAHDVVTVRPGDKVFTLGDDRQTW